MALKWIINSSNEKELKCLLDVSIIIGCKFIYNELKTEAYHDHFDKDMIEYANKLQNCINNINKNCLDIDINDQIEKIKFIINWLRFWGENNFGFYVILSLN